MLARVFVLTLAVPPLFRLPVRTVERVLTAGRVAPARDPIAAKLIIRCVRRVQRSRIRGLRRDCLGRGAVLFVLLRHAGYDVSLCFGVGHPDDRFAGHCWLELDGAPLLERRDPTAHFGEVFRMPFRAPGDASSPTRHEATRSA